jgi:phosphinothricin acetyltransferase
MDGESGELRARPATVDDAPAMCAIYNEGIEGRRATFETRLRAPDEVRAWFDGAHPIVAVELGPRVVAFAKTSTFNPRACYAHVAEFSVFVAGVARRRGAGRLAMTELVTRARQAGFSKLVSGVFTRNEASRAMLRGVGFRELGTYERHGELDGEWLDVVVVELLL